MEWKDHFQLAECGYYPSHTNMESNIDKWLLSDTLFTYVAESSLTYLSKMKKSTIPTVTKETVLKITDLLNSAIRSASS